MKTVLFTMIVMIALTSGAAEVVLDASGKVLLSKGAKVTDVVVDRDDNKNPRIAFQYVPEEEGSSMVLSIKNLSPRNWLVLEGEWTIGKWLDEQLIAGVDLGVQPAGRYTIGKNAGLVKPKNWNEWKRMHVEIQSTLDGTMQPSFVFVPERARTESVPLLVALHSWSFGCTNLNPGAWALEQAKQRGWALLYPHFRGPNNTPQGCGSDLAVQDIVDGVEYVKKQCKIDENRVYLLGGSGGGHMALLMAGRHPDIWAGVYAACPITDVGRWHDQSKDPSLNLWPHYAEMLEKVCGGTYSEHKGEYDHRSPVTWLANAKNVPIEIITGIHDGHRLPKGGGSVPCGHAVRGFNCIASERDRIPESVIEEIERTEKVPAAYAFHGEDPFFIVPEREIYLRRVSGNVRLTLFNAGHAGNYDAGMEWFERQRRGKPADWSPLVKRESNRAIHIREVTK